MPGIEDKLALVLEIHRDAAGDVGLHLPQTPVGVLGAAHQHAGFQYRAQIILHGSVRFMNDQSPQGPQSLAELIASRLCHDLVNPLGAIGNGVELIEMTGSVHGPEMAHDGFYMALLAKK